VRACSGYFILANKITQTAKYSRDVWEVLRRSGEFLERKGASRRIAYVPSVGIGCRVVGTSDIWFSPALILAGVLPPVYS